MKLPGLLALTLFALPAAAQDTGLGQRLFRADCASCHGLDARGKGWLAQYLIDSPADLTLLAKRNRNVFPADDVRATIDGRIDIAVHGPRDMPVWGEHYESALAQGSDAAAAAGRRIDALVEYLRSIQK